MARSLAAVYAGEVDEADLRFLLGAAGAFEPHLSQGAAFAAKARLRAGNSTPYTDRACEILCDLSVIQAAHLTDATLENLPTNQPEPAYELWRRRIQERFAKARQLRQ